MSKWDKLRRDVYAGKTISIKDAESAIYEEKKLAQLDRERNFKPNEEHFNLGIKWFESGLPFEEAEEGLRNDANFKNGFEVAKRRAYALELNEKAKRR